MVVVLKVTEVGELFFFFEFILQLWWWCGSGSGGCSGTDSDLPTAAEEEAIYKIEGR